MQITISGGDTKQREALASIVHVLVDEDVDLIKDPAIPLISDLADIREVVEGILEPVGITMAQEPTTTPKTQEVPSQDMLQALKDLYRLVEGTSGEIYETMNPYSRWQMQKAGRILNQAHGISTKSAIFDGEG